MGTPGGEGETKPHNGTVKTLPADGCYLGAACGLCWSRRIERMGVQPLTPRQWRSLLGPRTRGARNDDYDENVRPLCYAVDRRNGP